MTLGPLEHLNITTVWTNITNELPPKHRLICVKADGHAGHCYARYDETVDDYVEIETGKPLKITHWRLPESGKVFIGDII